jgi:pimeloyl-ACP methyl ester carboxylesterase
LRSFQFPPAFWSETLDPDLSLRQSHFLIRDVPDWGERTKAEWAFQPDGQAVVFVHGFLGSALGTWMRFPAMLRAEPKCAGCDLVFYGHDAGRRRVAASAYRLEQFLDALFSDPLAIINSNLDPEDRRPAPFSYRSMLLVAHSLGAVLCRQALLNAHLRRRTWPTKVRLVLFAPAHRWAHLIPLVNDAFVGMKVPLLGASMPILKVFWRALLDLSPGCQTLHKLLEDTEQELAQGSGDHLRAAVVIHSDRDNVVEQQRFDGDPPLVMPTVSLGHSAMCKPRPYYVDPIGVLTELL